MTIISLKTVNRILKERLSSNWFNNTKKNNLFKIGYLFPLGKYQHLPPREMGPRLTSSRREHERQTAPIVRDNQSKEQRAGRRVEAAACIGTLSAR